MVTPTRDAAESVARSRPPLLPLVILALLVGVVVLAAGWTGSAPEESEATTIPPLAEPTTPRLDLEWEAGFVGETWPLALLEVRGRWMLFGADPPDGGLEVWVSDDAVSWEAVGTVISPPAAISAVGETPSGLAATGFAEGQGDPAIWVSTDGARWLQTEFTAEVPPGKTIWLQDVAETGDRIVVVGSVVSDVYDVIRDRLPASADRFGWGWSSDPFTLQVNGPLGIAAATYDAEDLGLTTEQVEALEAGAGSESKVWSSSDGSAWEEASLPLSWVDHLEVDGTSFLASGDSRIAVSTDGVEWTTHPIGVERVHWWRENLFVGVRARSLHPELVFSEGGGAVWEAFPIADELRTRRNLEVALLDADEAGVAAAMIEYRPFQDPAPFELAGPGGYVLTADDEFVVLRKEGDLVLRVSRSTPGGEQVQVDLDDETLTFVDDTGNPLVTFTFEELERAERGRVAAADDRERTIVFSPDGETWAVLDLGALAEPGSEFSVLSVGGRRVAFATLVPSHARTPPRVTVWSAELP